MADGSAPEISSPQPSKAESKTANVWNSIKEKFGRKRVPSQNNFQPEQFAEFIDAPAEKRFTVSGFISESVREKGLKAPDFKSEGATGTIYATNERANSELITKLKNHPQAPDGYLVEVGGGNWATMLDTYPDGKSPKGIVLINIDPDNIGELKELVKALKGEAQVPDLIRINIDFVKNLSEEDYLKTTYNNGESPVSTPLVIARHWEELQKLAMAGNISIVQQNILEPKLMETIASLPEFKSSNNVINLSNISDWIWRANSFAALKRSVEDGTYGQPLQTDMDSINGPFDVLNGLASEPGHRNYFVDSTEKSLRYKTRISSRPPHFERGDFEPSFEPTFRVADQIDTTEDDIKAEGVYKDLSYVKTIEDYYRLKEDPNYKRAVKGQIERINDYRKRLGSTVFLDETTYESELIPGLGHELFSIQYNQTCREFGFEVRPDLRFRSGNENNWITWVTSQEIINMAQIYNNLYMRTSGGVKRGITAPELIDLFEQTYSLPKPK